MFLSVIIYLSLFIILSTLFWMAQVSFKSRKKNKLGLILSIIAIIIFCLFASLRNVNVGIDIKVYITPNFDYIIKNKINFLNFYKNQPISSNIGFAILTYLCSKTYSLKFFLFMIEFLIVFPVFLGLYRLDKKNYIFLGMSLFCFLFFNITLSVMRQGIAMSFIFLFVCNCFSKEKNKIIKCIVDVILAITFHSSAFIIALIIFLFYILFKNKCFKIITVISCLLIIFLFTYSSFLNVITPLISKIDARYAYYISRYYHKSFSTENLMATDLLFKTFIIIVPIFMLIISKKINWKIEFIVYLCLLGRYFMVLNGAIYESVRVAYYFDYFIIILAPMAFYAYKKSGILNFFTYRFSICTIEILGALCYWGYYIIFQNAYQTNNLFLIIT